MYYVTIAGDTWDMIAYKVYGKEIYADYLMKNNYDLLDIFVFSDGTKVYIPELPEITTADLPPWRS